VTWLLRTGDSILVRQWHLEDDGPLRRPGLISLACGSVIIGGTPVERRDERPPEPRCAACQGIASRLPTPVGPLAPTPEGAETP
jgi:hypothetical protein